MKKVFALLLACLLLACSALAEESVAYVNNSRGLIVRQEASFDSPIAGYIPFKETVTILEHLDNGFVKLSYDVLTGYSWAYYLTEEDISQKGDFTMYVTAWAGLNLHEEGTIESDIITGVPFGTEVTVKEIGELFTRCYVTLEGKLYKGYLWTGYLSKEVPDAAHAKEHHDAIVGSGLEGWDDAGNDSGSTSSGGWDWGW